MSRFRFAAVGVLALAAACSDAPSTPEAAPIPRPLASAADAVVPGEILVGMRDGFSANVLTGRSGVRFNRMGVEGRFAVLSVAAGSEREMAAELARDARVAYAEPNYLRRPHAIDSRLWAFFNPGGLRASFNDGSGLLPTTYSSLLDADIDNIESYGAGGAPVVIGSLDSGVDMDHPEFTGRLIAGRDWVSGDNNPEDEYPDGGPTLTGTAAVDLTWTGVGKKRPEVFTGNVNHCVGAIFEREVVLTGDVQIDVPRLYTGSTTAYRPYTDTALRYETVACPSPLG